MSKQYDVVIIGSGPGGYVAAIRCAQLGMKTAIIEKYNTLGGTCLNVGCIPSKALLDASEHYHFVLDKAKEIGINVGKVSLDFPKMIQKKAEIVKKITDGVAFLMKINKIDVYTGIGSIENPNSVKVQTDKEEILLQAKNIIIATGSKPSTIPGVEIDKERIITSTEALSLKEVPKTMVVIGGGVIGLEMGSVYARLGTKVTIVEYTDKIIPAMDTDLSKALKKRLQKELNIEFLLDHQVLEAKARKKSVLVKAKNKKSEEVVELKADYCLVATGRRPYTENLGIEKVGIAKDERGRILVNDNLQTNIPNIYAIGDVIRGPMLAHKASEEGVFVAEVIAGKKPHINYNAIPSVVYTWPEVASVGKTEQEVKAEGIPYIVGKFPFTALGRAIASNDPDGFVKIIAHKETDRILGMHIYGARAADLIMEGTIALEFKASAEDLGIITHPHPTFSEAVKEAALAANRRALHIKNK